MDWSNFITTLGGMFSSGVGQSGNQGGSTQNSTGTSKGTETSKITGTDTNSQLQKMLEDPSFAGLRTALQPILTQELANAQQPVYGKAQQGQFMSGLNDLTSSAMKSLSSTLAARGISDSGAAAEGYGGIEATRLGKASDFFAQLPFEEAKARAERVNPLLSMATGWVGKAPLDVSTTGSSTSNKTGTSDSTSTTTSSGTSTKQGVPWWKNVLSGMGDKMGDAAGAGKTGYDLLKTGLGLGGTAAAGTVAALPTYAGGAAGLTAAQLTPGFVAGGATGATGATTAGATGAAAGGGGAGALGALIGPGLMAGMIPWGNENSDSLIAKGVNKWGDFLGSKIPAFMYGSDPNGAQWDSYVYETRNQEGGNPTEEGFQEWLAKRNGVGG